MSGPRSRRVIALDVDSRGALERVTRRTTEAAGLVRRARIVLLVADGLPLDQIARQVGVRPNVVRTWADRYRAGGLDALQDRPRPGRPRTFPPEVALHLVRRACELPEQAGRSLSQWDCAELARQLIRDEVVASISPQTIQRMLLADRRKPWRSHVWLHPPVRRLRHPVRAGLWRDHPPQAPGRVPLPPGAPRPVHPRLGHHDSPARGQRLGPSWHARPPVARSPPALRRPLHPGPLFVDEPRGAMVRDPATQAAPLAQLP